MPSMSKHIRVFTRKTSVAVKQSDGRFSVFQFMILKVFFKVLIMSHTSMSCSDIDHSLNNFGKLLFPSNK